MTIPARYENGVFRPLQDVPVKEGTVVEVLLPAETPERQPSIANSPFAGMWKDREATSSLTCHAAAIKYVDDLPEPWAISQVTTMERQS